MDTLWKWIMHLNAKAFCLVAVIGFLLIGAWCAYRYTTPPHPFQHGTDKPAAPEQLPELTILEFVSNQLNDVALSIPSDPFRPTLEAIFTNEIERAAFIKALKEAQARAAEGGAQAAKADAGKREDPFAHLRKKSAPDDKGLVDATGRKLITPKLSFLGFVKRSDNTQAALFHNSTDNSLVFYDAAQGRVHGVEIVSADVRQAQIKLPDGTSRALKVGESVELAPEPAPDKPKPNAPAAKQQGRKQAQKNNQQAGQKQAQNRRGNNRPAQNRPNPNRARK